MFKGRRTFSEFQDAGEGIATNILAERLTRLESGGIITRHRDADDGRRVVYRLTSKGLDLAPVLVELVLWSAKHEETEAPPAEIRVMRRDREGFLRNLRKQLTAGS